MEALDLLIGSLGWNLEFLKSHVADFSEADMLVRPVPGANHTAWQLGHVLVSERSMVNGVKPGVMPPLPEGFAEKFSKETAKIDDPNAFPSKAEILDAFDKTRAGTIAWAKSLSAADLDAPAPERMRKMAPTLGQMLALVPNHVVMHMGQIQVIRRKLGRPILF